VSFSLWAQVIPYPEQYLCYKTDDTIIIDGSIQDSAWLQTEWTRDFKDIQGDSMPTPKYQTKVKMLWDDDYLYIAAYLEEPHIWATLTERESIMYYDNDFEIFIDPDNDHHEYYEFEFNAYGTEWDLYLSKPYRNGGRPIFGWDADGMQSAVKVYGTINDPSDIDSCWTFEVKIPWDCIRDAAYEKMMIAEEGFLRINFSRVQWETKIENSEYVKLKKPEDNWVWSPTGKINMHMPEMWGYVKLVKPNPETGFVCAEQDLNWPSRAIMMEIYYAQKAYYAKHKRYTSDISKLNLPKGIPTDQIKLENCTNQFTASYDDEYFIWTIDQTSRLWHTKSTQ
jgi:hypothetical protein